MQQVTILDGQISAAAELLRRRAIRRDLAEWGRYKGFEPAPHHQLICREIDAFLNSDDEVLLLFAPPGSAKSTWVSVLFPSYYLARFPNKSILAATHSVEFAQRWGRRVRNDIALDSTMLGIALAHDSQASDRWALTSGGEYYGVGAGVGISGFRADLGLGDDFFGNREDAYSETVRKKRWEWYVDDFSARLKPNAKRILMNTRWHEDDVAGRVLDQIERGIVRGRVISIPAIAETHDALDRKPGEYLWDDPEGYDYGSFLRARQRESSPMMWAALYQQRPAPEEGDYFKAAWLRDCDAAPPLEPCMSTAEATMQSPRMAATTPFMSSSAWTLSPGSMCWTSGEDNRLRTNGSRRCAISFKNGSRSVGRKRPARFARASARSLNGGCGNAGPGSTARRFRHAATRRFAPNRSVAGWR
jgi:hypothetical protein